ncbi:MAG: GGDEF domain-containing protein [Steroidobacteraceae bacterium]
MQLRRRTDPPLKHDRRSSAADRRAAVSFAPSIRFPSRQEQALQFLTRYLFSILGLIFFNYSDDFIPKWLMLWQINVVFGSYIFINTVNFAHAWFQPVSPLRYRIALWVDVLMVSICVVNDPNDIPPSLVAYIVVVLGNGMRYGMRFFAEAIVGTLLGGAIAVSMRYTHFLTAMSPGAMFLSLFGAIIMVYAYILMSRVERARHRSEHVSRTDPLTGLLNRRGLAEAANGWLSHAKWSERRLIVMFADLDNFKMVNDKHGHAEGDRVLATVAGMLLETTRSTDLVARYGGDEFVLLLTDTDLASAQLIAQRIQVTIEDWMRSNHFSCGISIGVNEAPPGELKLADVLHSVDVLLYEAKIRRNGSGDRRALVSATE